MENYRYAASTAKAPCFKPKYCTQGGSGNYISPRDAAIPHDAYIARTIRVTDTGRYVETPVSQSGSFYLSLTLDFSRANFLLQVGPKMYREFTLDKLPQVFEEFQLQANTKYEEVYKVCRYRNISFRTLMHHNIFFLRESTPQSHFRLQSRNSKSVAGLTGISSSYSLKISLQPQRSPNPTKCNSILSCRHNMVSSGRNGISS